jgi:hypothetical protein
VWHRGLWTLDADGLYGGVDHWQLMAMGALHGEAEGPAMAGRQHAPGGPERAAIGGVFAHRLPPQAGPWSSRRPSPALPTPGLSAAHTSATPPARAARTPGLPAPPESAHAPYGERPRGAAARSMGNRCATPRQWRSSRAGPPAGAGPLACGLWAMGGRAPSAPTAHQGSGSRGPPPKGVITHLGALLSGPGGTTYTEVNTFRIDS